MELIAHRVNKITKLKKLPLKYGAEIDIRDSGKELIVVHDPFKKGEKLEKFLKNYKHKTLIANVKSERIKRLVISTKSIRIWIGQVTYAVLPSKPCQKCTNRVKNVQTVSKMYT